MGLYEWLIGGADAGVIEAHMREQEGFDKVDAVHFDALLHGCVREAADLDAVLARHVDRKTTQLSPIEHAILLIGAEITASYPLLAAGRFRPVPDPNAPRRPWIVRAARDVAIFLRGLFWQPRTQGKPGNPPSARQR